MLSDGVVWLFYGFASGAIMMATVCGCDMTCNYQRNAEVIKHGAAYYHPETGAFTWKDEATDAAIAENDQEQ